MHTVRRVLMTADAVGGVWNYALELARGLDAAGVEVLLATMGPRPSAAQLAAVPRSPRLKLRISTYKLEWMEQPWADVQRAGQWLLALEREFRPDVVHLNGYAHAALPWRAPTLVVGHSCVCSWFAAVRGAPAPAEWDTYRHVVRTGLAAATAVTAPSAAMLAELGRHYGTFRAVRPIHNGRDAREYHPAKLKKGLVLAVGRVWDEAKNIPTLDAIAPLISWPIVVAGDARSPDGSSRGPVNLDLLGALSPHALAQWYARAAIFALPARYEPFGLAALEAGLAGCALVLGDIPSLREIWGDAADYVPPNDPAALVSRLQLLIGSPARRAMQGRRAQIRAGHYTAGRMVRDYLGLYEALTRKRSLSKTPGGVPPSPALSA